MNGRCRIPSRSTSALPNSHCIAPHYLALFTRSPCLCLPTSMFIRGFNYRFPPIHSPVSVIRRVSRSLLPCARVYSTVWPYRLLARSALLLHDLLRVFSRVWGFTVSYSTALSIMGVKPVFYTTSSGYFLRLYTRILRRVLRTLRP